MIKNSKGMSGLFWIIIIIVIVLFAAGTILAIQVIAQKTATKLGQAGEQLGVATKILPKDWYKITVFDAIEGELTLAVEDTKGTDSTADDVYVTDFSPVTGYKVYDNGVQTTVNNVGAYPTAYIVLVGDPKSTAGNILGALSNLSVVNSYLGVIPMASSTTPPEFKSPKESVAAFVELVVNNPGISNAPADYWGALANAKQSLPTIPAMRDIGPNFLGVILVSDGRCDAGTDICTNETAISQALDMPSDTHFYLLTSDCQIPFTSNADANKDRLNLTLESYANLKRASCYTNNDTLYSQLLKDMSTIKVEYAPKFVSATITSAQYHNITVTITKRTGLLGAQSAYSGTTTVKTSEKY